MNYHNHTCFNIHNKKLEFLNFDIKVSATNKIHSEHFNKLFY